MALKQDVFQAKRRMGNSKPVDLAHLGQQTMGDENLEAEILSMFVSQSDIYLKMILRSCDSPTRIRAAHSLKGAARSIGAFELADLAEAAEKHNHKVHSQIEQELDRVVGYIATLH
jgi:HPt (histidine-containing phosphotransfer) domain-containing protein